MFRLTSANLPLKKIPQKAAPVFKIWHSNERGTGPILRVNYYGNWWENPGWELDTVPLGIPFAKGQYYYCQISSEFTIISIPGWHEVDSAIAATSNTFWQSDGYMGFYKSLDLPSTAQVTLTLVSPSPVSNNYVIAVPPGFTATSISSQGLIFNSGSEIGNFSQTDATITIYGSAAYSLELGQELEITGNLEFGSFTLVSSIASFNLEIDHLDRIGWVGRNFSPALSAIAPKLWEFTWSGENHIANLFLKSTSMPYFPKYEEIVISKSSGVVNFDR